MTSIKQQYLYILKDHTVPTFTYNCSPQCMQKIFIRPHLFIGNDFNFVNLKYIRIPQGHCGFNSIKRIVWKVSEVTSLKNFLQFETILKTLNTEFFSDHLAPQKKTTLFKILRTGLNPSPDPFRCLRGMGLGDETMWPSLSYAHGTIFIQYGITIYRDQ